MSKTFVVLCVAALALSSGRAHAQFVYNEQTLGDLSGNRLQPTALTAAAGENFLFGVMGGSPGADVDLDYFSVTIPAGHQLDHLVLEFYESFDSAAFIGMVPGATFSIAPEDATPDNLLGWVHFGPARVNSDLLTAMSSNGIGFSTPLGEGTYSFWAQQLDDNTEWTARFEVSAVPAPGMLGACVGGVMLLSRRRRTMAV